MDVTASVARRSILDFLRRTKCEAYFPPRTPPPAVEAQVRETVRKWNLDQTEEYYEKHLIVGLDIAYAAYQHTPYEVQIAVALFTFCATVLDDAAIDMRATHEFIARFCAGEPQLHPILTRFIETAGALREFVPEYTANTIYPSMLSFVNEDLYGRKGAQQLVLCADSGDYIDYSRFKGGMPEPYAVCIWPRSICPDAEEYVQALP